MKILGSIALTTAAVALLGGHINYFKTPDPIITKDYKFEFKNPVAHQTYCKFGYSIHNTSDDILVYKQAESSIEIAGKKQSETPKTLYLQPGKKNFFPQTYTVNGQLEDYHVDKFSFNLDGVYKLPTNGAISKGENFKLPAATNEIKIGDFTITLKSLDKKTKETEAKFEVLYTGPNFGLINSSKISASVPDKGATIFANDNKNSDYEILEKGEKVTIKVVLHIPARYADMQFANMEIIWNDAFTVSKASKIAGAKVDFEIDPGLTDGKN